VSHAQLLAGAQLLKQFYSSNERLWWLHVTGIEKFFSRHILCLASITAPGTSINGA